VPLAHVEWDETIIPKSVDDVAAELFANPPYILAGASLQGLMLSPQTLQPGEERIVAERVAQLLSA
jgi:hypothetical protein